MGSPLELFKREKTWGEKKNQTIFPQREIPIFF